MKTITLTRNEEAVKDGIYNSANLDHSIQQQVFAMLRSGNGSIERVAQYIAQQEDTASAKQIKVLRNQVSRAGETLQSQEGVQKTDPEYKQYSIKCTDRKTFTFEIVAKERKQKATLETAFADWKKSPTPELREALEMALDKYTETFFDKLDEKISKAGSDYLNALERGDKASAAADKHHEKFTKLRMIKDSALEAEQVA